MVTFLGNIKPEEDCTPVPEANTDAILAELGFSVAEFAGLRARK